MEKLTQIVGWRAKSVWQVHCRTGLPATEIGQLGYCNLEKNFCLTIVCYWAWPSVNCCSTYVLKALAEYWIFRDFQLKLVGWPRHRFHGCGHGHGFMWQWPCSLGLKSSLRGTKDLVLRHSFSHNFCLLWVFFFPFPPSAMNWGIRKFWMHLSVRTPSLTVPLPPRAPGWLPRASVVERSPWYSSQICWWSPSSPSASLLTLPHLQQQLCSVLPPWYACWGAWGLPVHPMSRSGEVPQRRSLLSILSTISVSLGWVSTSLL